MILLIMKEPLSYVPLCLTLAMLGLMPVSIVLWKDKKLTLCSIIWWYCMLAYVLIVIMITIFSREPGSRKGIDLQLFATWGASTQAKAYVIENIFMFIPFGVLRAIRKKKNSKTKEIFIYITASCLIEGIQLITGRGYCQLDDVVMNTFGGIIGYLFVIILNNLFKKIKG